MQRAGRAGRVRPGKAFRLCTAEDYAKLPDVTVPEMQRAELQGMVLQVCIWGDAQMHDVQDYCLHAEQIKSICLPFEPVHTSSSTIMWEYKC